MILCLPETHLTATRKVNDVIDKNYFQEPISRERIRLKYGFHISYTNFNGCKGSFSVTECDSMIEAVNKTIDFAKQCGWTPPKWWQWWRWGDSNPKRIGE